MKRLISFFLCLLLLVPAGCASPTPVGGTEGEKLRIVVTIYPAYDWVLQILGDRADRAQVTLLLDGGADMHSYQPTVDDVVRISACDLFVYVGGESDAWAEDALKEAVNENMTAVSLLQSLGDSAREEETVEGMEAEEEDGPEGPTYDEHVWLSLKNASLLCRKLSEALCRLDPQGREEYEDNTREYLEKLEALDGQYASAAQNSRHKTLLFGDRFPFRYLTEDYGVGYYAAFPGCSAETEASFGTVVFLAGKLDELGLPAILQIEGSDGSIARTVLENAKSENLSILTLDSMQAVSAREGEARGGYLGIMEENLAVWKTALG